MHVLEETPVGFAVFRSAPLELSALKRFESAGGAVEETVGMLEGRIPNSVVEMIVEGKLAQIGVSSAKVAEALGEALRERNHAAKIKTGGEVEEIGREIHARLPELLSMTEEELGRAQLLLAHALTRKKLQMTPERLDLVLVQSVRVLDKLDKDINNKCMRVREWHGLYFPELSEMVGENRRYMGILHESLAGSEISDDLKEEIEEARKKTVGGEISAEDADLLRESVASVLQMYEARERLQEHLRRRMRQIAPNLLALLGEYLGAKLVEHAGSLGELARKPASTIQIMGSEASLFKTLKEKAPTPKYGYIYNSAFVGQAAHEIKGQVARTLAAKIALASRCDMAGEEESGEYGAQMKAYVEKRAEQLGARKRAAQKPQHARPEKFAFKRPSPYPSSHPFKKPKQG